MLRMLNGEVRKHGTWPTGRFQLCQTSVNIQFPHLRVMILHCDVTNGMKGLHSILTMNFIQDY